MFLVYNTKAGEALTVLTQKLGMLLRPVAYFSEQQHSVSAGQPTRLTPVVTQIIFVGKVTKQTLDQKLEVQLPCQRQLILEMRGHQWLTG